MLKSLQYILWISLKLYLLKVEYSPAKLVWPPSLLITVRIEWWCWCNCNPETESSTMIGAENSPFVGRCININYPPAPEKVWAMMYKSKDEDGQPSPPPSSRGNAGDRIESGGGILIWWGGGGKFHGRNPFPSNLMLVFKIQELHLPGFPALPPPRSLLSSRLSRSSPHTFCLSQVATLPFTSGDQSCQIFNCSSRLETCAESPLASHTGFINSQERSGLTKTQIFVTQFAKMSFHHPETYLTGLSPCTQYTVSLSPPSQMHLA